MILYLTAKTKTPDLFIDCIEIRLKNGCEVILTWDESEVVRTKTGFEAKYKGVYFDEEYANGKLKELEGMKITYVGVHLGWEEDCYEVDDDFRITHMLFVDGDYENHLKFTFE